MKQKIDLNGKTILVTGSPGFIGANLVLRLLREMTSGTVVSFDNMNDYYDPKLKEYRLGLIEKAAKDNQLEGLLVRWVLGLSLIIIGLLVLPVGKAAGAKPEVYLQPVLTFESPLNNIHLDEDTRQQAGKQIPGEIEGRIPRDLVKHPGRQDIHARIHLIS